MSHEYIDMGKPAFRRNQLENDLRRQIKMRSGDFDEPLATEQKLSATYQLSRNTIRKVLQKLQNEGLLIRKTGFGTYIVPPEQRPAGKVRLGRILLSTRWNMNDFFVQRLAAGIQEYTYLHSTRLEIVKSDTLTLASMTANYRALKYDAIIHDRPVKSQYPMIEELSRIKVPQVTLNRSVSDIPAVFVDHNNTVCQVVDFFHGLGLQPACFVDMPWNEPIFEQRQQTFLQELRKKKIPHPEDYLYIYSRTGSIHDKFTEYVRKHPEIRAFLIIRAFMDTALQVFGELNLKIPQDVSVIMLDEDPRRPEFSTLSVFREPIRQLGFTAAEILFQYLSDDPPRKGCIYLPGELVLRKSCRYPYQ